MNSNRRFQRILLLVAGILILLIIVLIEQDRALSAMENHEWSLQQIQLSKS